MNIISFALAGVLQATVGFEATRICFTCGVLVGDLADDGFELGQAGDLGEAGDFGEEIRRVLWVDFGELRRAPIISSI